MDKKKQRSYHARDRTRKYQKKRMGKRFAKDRRDQANKSARRDRRGGMADLTEEKTIRRRKLKKRTTYLFANKLRYETEVKPISALQSNETRAQSQTDDTSSSIATETVIAGRKLLYRRKTYSKAFRDKALYKPKSSDEFSAPKETSLSNTPSISRENAAVTPTDDIRQSIKHDRNHRIQKNRTKRDYTKAYRKSKTGHTPMPWEKGSRIFSKPSGSGAVSSIKEIFDNKSKYGIVLAVILVFIVLTVSITFIGTFVGGIATVVASTTYPSSEEDISDTDAAYAALEDALNNQINSMEASHPGYDEYRYQVDEISHNPYELISYLTVKYGGFTYADVKEELKELFNKQYTLRVWEETEIRTRTVTDPETGEETTEEYEYRILNISLTNRGIRSIAAEEFTPEKLQLFDTYNSLHGNRDGIFDESLIPADVDRYEIPPEALSDERFARMINEAEKYLGYPYVWGGSNPSTSFDCSGFVSYVINHSGNGWNVGRNTAEGLRQATAYVPRDQAKPGDLIFFQGTYSTSGASHVGIYVGGGMMIHCGNPIQYASINTPYWQQHFYEFGRLP